MTNTEARRRAFDEWLTNSKYALAMPVNRKYMFEAWQAALDSVVVRIPTIHRDGDEGYNNGIEHCREAIHAAGVRTK